MSLYIYHLYITNPPEINTTKFIVMYVNLTIVILTISPYVFLKFTLKVINNFYMNISSTLLDINKLLFKINIYCFDN